MSSGAHIERVELQRVEGVPLARPLALAWDPGTVRRVDSFTIARVHTADGRVGVGTVGRSKPARETARHMLGTDPAAVAGDPGLLERTGGYGLDIALWDLVGQRRGEPLWQVWGGSGAGPTRAVPAYASTVELGSPDRRADDAVGFADEGFQGFKIRLHHETLAEDLALANAVREAVGDRLVLMADANQARAAAVGGPVRWDRARAVATARALADLGYAWLEEPLAADDLEGLARLRGEGGLPIAGGERDQGHDRLAALAGGEAYDIVQPDGVTGGAVGWFPRLAALAATRGARLIPHHGGGGVGAWAHLHLAAAVPNAGWVEVIRDRPGETPWPAQLVPRPPVLPGPDGRVAAPAAPGLGIELDEELLAAHTVSVTVIR